MLEQCCKYSKQCRNNVATLCCAKNRCCESSRLINSPADRGDEKSLNGTWSFLNKSISVSNALSWTASSGYIPTNLLNKPASHLLRALQTQKQDILGPVQTSNFSCTELKTYLGWPTKYKYDDWFKRRTLLVGLNSISRCAMTYNAYQSK